MENRPRVDVVKKIVRIICSILLSISIVFLALMCVIAKYSSTSYPTAESAIVLGAGLTTTDVPSPVLAGRIEYAIDLYHSNSIKKIYFTGGSSVPSKVSEAAASESYARARGVAPEALFIETRSHSTIENFKNILNQLPPDGRVLVVTDPLHEFRAIRIARDLGIDAYPAPTPYTRFISLKTQLPFLARETYFMLKYWLRIGY